MSKIIFLDIDGVLNRHHERYRTKEKSPMGFIGVGKKHLTWLKYIVDKTDATIILSSDWKMCFDIKTCKSINPDGAYLIKRLGDYGLTIKECTDDRSVGREYSTGRGYGIRKYLKNHPEVTDYVILDDIWFEDYTDELTGHVVYLNYPLTKRSAEKAVKVLEGKLLNNEETKTKTLKSYEEF